MILGISMAVVLDSGTLVTEEPSQWFSALETSIVATQKKLEARKLQLNMLV